KCILSSPYKPTTVLVQAVETTDDSPAVPEHSTVETPTNMSPENKAHFLAEKEVIHLILTGIRYDIYSTVDACQIAQEMWESIERLQQGNSRMLSRNVTSRKTQKTKQMMTRPRYMPWKKRENLPKLVGRLSSHTNSPGKEYWDAVNQVFKYLKKTIDYGLEYSRDPSVLEAEFVALAHAVKKQNGYETC
nr:zinc finger, CCHC-type [Tanacetum cinerariifolium]